MGPSLNPCRVPHDDESAFGSRVAGGGYELCARADTPQEMEVKAHQTDSARGGIQ